MEFAPKIKITGGGQHRNSGGQHHQIMQLHHTWIDVSPFNY